MDEFPDPFASNGEVVCAELVPADPCVTAEPMTEEMLNGPEAVMIPLPKPPVPEDLATPEAGAKPEAKVDGRVSE